MDDKRMTVKKALEMSEAQEQSESFEDKALEQFVRKPEETNLYNKFISVSHFFLLFFLLCVICACSIISSTKGWMEPFVAIPIAFLSMIGIVVLAIDAKKNDEENNKKYKWYSICFIKRCLKGGI